MDNVVLWLANFAGIAPFDFGSPLWLFALLLWPVFLPIQCWLNKRSVFVSDDISQLHQQQQLSVKHALLSFITIRQPSTHTPARQYHWLQLLLNILRGTLLTALVITLAQPQRTQLLTPQTQTESVRDIVFVIESSASFLLPDYQINGQPQPRMEAVKHVLDQFVAALPGNRFSYIIYADSAYTLMPLTADQDASRRYLKQLKPYLAGRNDFAIGEAMGLAIKQTLTTQATEHTQKRLVVLISDGMNKPSRLPVDDAINYAQVKNVPIYTIGVGAQSEEADRRQYSGLLYQALESESLKRIATETQGRYFQIGNEKELNQVLTEIDRAEGATITVETTQKRIEELYHYPLLISVISFALYLLLSLISARFIQQRTPRSAEE